MQMYTIFTSCQYFISLYGDYLPRSPRGCLKANLMCLGTKKPEDFHLPAHFSGEGGIRTPGSSQINGFQDRRNRPLCHLSSSSAFALGLQR